MPMVIVAVPDPRAGQLKAEEKIKLIHQVRKGPTWWRMTLAARHLRDSTTPLNAIAGKVGYTSEYAFAHAFKREHGLAPGRYRQAHRNSQPDRGK
jgi:methylphosphotriester-DNA--protein-cysteine methyltransferase